MERGKTGRFLLVDMATDEKVKAKAEAKMAF
jgi:hypothetical protein